MAQKNTSGISALQKMNTTTVNTEKKVATDETPKAAVEPKKPIKVEEPKEKRKVGRPKTKTEDTKTINIAVPVSVLEKLDTVKVCYGNNLTQYINKLIEKDIEENFTKYQAVVDSLNSFNN